MISHNFSVFDIDGVSMQFDVTKFKSYFTNYCRQNGKEKIKIADAEQQLGDFVHVSKEAVHQWRFGNNGPATLDMIKQIAIFLSLDSHLALLSENKECNKMKYSTEQQKSFKCIYDAIIEFLDEFEKTDGFNSLWFDFQRQGIQNPETDIEIYAENLIDKIWLVFKKEYFYLHDTEPYVQLEDYISDVLYDTYSGKCSYAYRFEAPVETVDGKPSGITVEEDYTNALSLLNAIIEPITN